MNFNYKDFENALLSLEKELGEKERQADEAKAEMRECLDQIAAIKAKYDYHAKENRVFNLEYDINDISDKIDALKLKYVCNVIYEYIKSETLSETSLMRWLCDKFGFSYRPGSMHSYENFYEDVFDEDYFDYDDVSIDVQNRHVITYSWYFRNYLDDEVSIGIPENILDDINGFVDSLENKMLEEKQKVDMEKIKKENEAKEKRRQMYLELKKEFE